MSDAVSGLQEILSNPKATGRKIALQHLESILNSIPVVDDWETVVYLGTEVIKKYPGKSAPERAYGMCVIKLLTYSHDPHKVVIGPDLITAMIQCVGEMSEHTSCFIDFITGIVLSCPVCTGLLPIGIYD